MHHSYQGIKKGQDIQPIPVLYSNFCVAIHRLNDIIKFAWDVATTRFGNLSRFETETSHFATSMVLSWDAHLETHSPHRCLLGLHSHDALIVIVLQYLHINIHYCSYSFIYTLLDAHIQIGKMRAYKMGSCKMGSFPFRNGKLPVSKLEASHLKTQHW